MSRDFRAAPRRGTASVKWRPLLASWPVPHAASCARRQPDVLGVACAGVEGSHTRQAARPVAFRSDLFILRSKLVRRPGMSRPARNWLRCMVAALTQRRCSRFRLVLCWSRGASSDALWSMGDASSDQQNQHDVTAGDVSRLDAALPPVACHAVPPHGKSGRDARRTVSPGLRGLLMK